MKYFHKIRIVKFAIVGCVGFLVNALLVDIIAGHYNPIIAQVIAFPAAVTSTWFLNRHFTFESSCLSAHREWIIYVIASAGGWLANNGMYYMLILLWPLAYRFPIIAVASGSLSGMLINYFSASRFVFGANR